LERATVPYIVLARWRKTNRKRLLALWSIAALGCVQNGQMQSISNGNRKLIYSTSVSRNFEPAHVKKGRKSVTIPYFLGGFNR
jgi:hypothetical protein